MSQPFAKHILRFHSKSSVRKMSFSNLNLSLSDRGPMRSFKPYQNLDNSNPDCDNSVSYFMFKTVILYSFFLQ